MFCSVVFCCVVFCYYSVVVPCPIPFQPSRCPSTCRLCCGFADFPDSTLFCCTMANHRRRYIRRAWWEPAQLYRWHHPTGMPVQITTSIHRSGPSISSNNKQTNLSTFRRSDNNKSNERVHPNFFRTTLEKQQFSPLTQTRIVHPCAFSICSCCQ